MRGERRLLLNRRRFGFLPTKLNRPITDTSNASKPISVSVSHVVAATFETALWKPHIILNL